MATDSRQHWDSANQITERIIAGVYRVSNALGSGFVEKVYENALAIELSRDGLEFEQQHPVRVFYTDHPVGDFVADLLVENSVVVELKAVKALDDIHAAQCLNYLKATKLKICLLVNFGRPRVELRRIVLDY